MGRSLGFERNNIMEIKYFEEDITIECLESLLGVPIKSLSVGAIETGEIVDDFDAVGNSCRRNIKKTGIEVGFDVTPTEEILNKLDLLFTNFKRVGGKSIADKVAEMEGRIKTLEGRVVGI